MPFPPPRWLSSRLLAPLSQYPASVSLGSASLAQRLLWEKEPSRTGHSQKMACVTRFFPCFRVTFDKTTYHQDFSYYYPWLLGKHGLLDGVDLVHATLSIRRSLEKLTKLIDYHMESANCQKMILPTISPSELWQQSGRLESAGKELIRMSDRHGRGYVFSPTHEEPITHLVANIRPLSRNLLPLKLYQITSKFRDEMKPRYGLLRAREFLMKDLYTFDITEEDAKKTYQEITEVYQGFFKDLGVPFIRVKADPGEIGGNLSHEFHFLSEEIGQDTLEVCSRCNRERGRNVEVQNVTFSDCPVCSGDPNLNKVKGIEVGHTFYLSQKYSKVFNAAYEDNNGKTVLQMGCFGLGVTRILAASAEVLSAERQLRWPSKIAPFTLAVLPAKSGSKEADTLGSKAIDIYDHLNRSIFPSDVLLDDRPSSTVGKKLREARGAGIPYALLFGKDLLQKDDPRVEVHQLYDDNAPVVKVRVEEIIDTLKEFANNK